MSSTNGPSSMLSPGYVQTGLVAAANNTQTAALQIISGPICNQIATCTATNNSCLLPLNPSVGSTCKIRNDGAVSLNVFPQTGGQINALGVNVAYVVPPAGVVEFIAISTLNYVVINHQQQSFDSGNILTVGDQAGGAGPTLTSANAGIVFISAQTTGATAIGIPTPVGNLGLRYRFIANATLGQNVVITPAAGACWGVLANVPVGGAYLGCINKATISMLAAATLGTSLEMISDGSHWIVQGFAPTATSWA